MTLPFTPDQFFSVFEAYNLAIWPAQIVAYLLALAVLVLLQFKAPLASKLITGVLALFWLWAGVFYHLGFFIQINGLAIVFGVLFVLEGLLIARAGLLRNTLRFRPRRDMFALLGALMMIYAMVIYPLLGSIWGHAFPRSPAFGVAPCPTTIFTFGVLLWTESPLPLHLGVIPLLWTLVGTSAAFSLGVREDYGMLIAALLFAASLVIRDGKGWKTHREPVSLQS